MIQREGGGSSADEPALCAATRGWDRWGYDLLRRTGIDRSTHGTKRFCRKLARQGFNPEVDRRCGSELRRLEPGCERRVQGCALFPDRAAGRDAAVFRAFLPAQPGSKWFLAGAGAAGGELALTVWDDLQGSAFLRPKSRR